MKPKNIHEDRNYILAYQNGDNNALNELVSKYYTYIYKVFCIKRVSKTDAEDFTHDICMRLISALKTFKHESNFKTYLDKMINNKVIDYYRHNIRVRQESLFKIIYLGQGNEIELCDLLQNGTVEPDQQIIYDELKTIIQFCLAAIQNNVMQQLVNLWLYGLKRRQMAELLDVSLGYVNGTLERGKGVFRKCVRQKYGLIDN